MPSKRYGPKFYSGSKAFYSFLFVVVNAGSSRVPLLGPYGAVPKRGLTMPKLPEEENVGVIVVEVGDNKVYVTDLKGAKEILNESKHNTSWVPMAGPQRSFQESYRDDTLALIMSGDDQTCPKTGYNPYTVKPIPRSNGLGVPSREHTILQEFLSRIQNFPFGGQNGTEHFWRMRFPLVITGALLLLTMLLALVWVLKFRGGFQADPAHQFNYHPIFMIAGFIMFSGFSMLFYRSLACYDKLTVKLLHTAFHLISIVCIAIGYTSAQSSLAVMLPNKPSFCSLHSWLGLTTMVLFVVQTRSSSWRAALLPNHATMGLITFVMAAATAVTGLTEKAIFTLQDAYIMWEVEEVAYVNTLGMLITAATVTIVFTLRDDGMKRVNQPKVYSIRNIDN